MKKTMRIISVMMAIVLIISSLPCVMASNVVPDEELAMVRYKSVTCKGTKLTYRYICPNYANLLQRSGCAYKYLPDEDLKDVLGRLIAQEAALAVDTAALLEQKRDTGPTVIDLKLARAKTEWDSLVRLRERLMRDFLAGVLNKEDHDRMKQRYAQEAADLERSIAQLQKEQRREKRLLTTCNPWLAAFRKHKNKVELTRELTQALVERITVYAENRVEIQLKYRDERAALLDDSVFKNKEEMAS